MSKNTIKKVTSFDVARHAGVSRSAVSRAFTQGANISETTRQKIIVSAQALGYQVNYLARDLQNSHSSFVGILTNRIQTPFRSKQVAAITENLLNIGYRPIILNTDSTQAKEMLLDLLGYRMAGFIVTSDTPPTDIVEKCYNFHIPVVFVNRFYDKNNVERIELDFVECGQMVFDMLRPAAGETVGVIDVREHSYSVSGRANAFVDICCKRGICVHKFRIPTQSYQTGYHIAAEIYTYMQHTPLNGIFAVTDLVACGIYDGLQQRGVHIPQDTQLVGFDDIEQASWRAYQLSTVLHDVDWQMQQVVDLLKHRIQDVHTPYRVVTQKIAPVHRKTTRPLY